MARENQGLQIALIVFVLFTIILGVTTFIFSSDCRKWRGLAADAEAKASESDGALSAAEDENMRLKAVVGHADTATLTVVDEEFNKDMQTYAQNYNDANRSYRTVCQWLFEEVQRKNEALSAEKLRVQQLKDANANLEAAKEQQIQQLLARAKKAEEDLAAERAKFQQAQVQLVNSNKQLQGDKQQVLQDSQVVKAQASEAIQKKDGEIKQQNLLIQELTTKIDELDPIVVDQPDGVITYAGRGNHVSINLGPADGLTKLTNFAVFARDMTDVTTAGRKGAIEVIDFEGEHTAVARIVEEDVSNPILQGDKIFTPLWKPGQRERFALTDGMDLDGDGRSDIDDIRNLISANGGVVDCWLDDEGQRYGEMTSDTRYLVKGTQPDEGNTIERINARTKIEEDAKKLGLRTLTLQEMLNRMGYRHDERRVVRFDSQKNPNDFRARAPEGVPRESSGRVSDLFEKRMPPRPAVNSAY